MKFGKYRHYSGKMYEVLNVVKNTETREKMVLYRPLYECPDLQQEYGEDPWFVRPYDMFNGSVEIGGIKKPRFEYLEDEPQA